MLPYALKLGPPKNVFTLIGIYVSVNSHYVHGNKFSSSNIHFYHKFSFTSKGQTLADLVK